MKRNMEIVEAKKDAFRNYKRFVDQIDRDLKKHTSITQPKIKSRISQNGRSQIKKLILNFTSRLEMRTQVPVEFKPEANTKGRQNTLSNSAAINKVLQTTSEPIRIDKAALKPRNKNRSTVRQTDTRIRNAKIRRSKKLVYTKQ